MQRFQRNSRGFLLGVLLRAPAATADGLARHERHDLERAVVRRPDLAGDDVLDDGRAAREALLQADLKSTGCERAFVISGWNASTTAAAVRS